MPLFIFAEGLMSTLSEFPLFALCLGFVGAAVLLFLLCILLLSYPLVLFGSGAAILAGILALTQGYIFLGLFWTIFAVVVCVASALHLYKNVRGAVWWSIGAILALIATAVCCSSQEVEPLKVLVPVAIFLVVGLLGSLIYPRVMFKNRKAERQHSTNCDPYIGITLAVTKDPDGEFPARGTIGDIDWSIRPFFLNEKFKSGDIVKVVRIEGVTLICTRDGKDLRSETRAKRAKELEERRNALAEQKAIKEANELKKALEKEEEKKLKKEQSDTEKAEKLSRKEEALEKRCARKIAKLEAKTKAREAKNAGKSKEKPIAEKAVPSVMKESKKHASKSSKFTLYVIISVIVMVILVALAAFLSIKMAAFYPLGTILLSDLAILCLMALLVVVLVRALTKKYGQLTETAKVKVEEPKVEEVKVEEPKVEEVKAPEVEEAPAQKEKAEFIPFAVRMKKSSKELKDAYNELKSEVLSYGIKSRVSSTGDTFRLHTKEYVKMVIAGKCLKLYLALNPRDYRDTTYPFDDASKMSAHKETPFVFKIKSGLSVRRAKVLISDVAKKNGLTQGEVVPHNHAKDLQ